MVKTTKKENYAKYYRHCQNSEPLGLCFEYSFKNALVQIQFELFPKSYNPINPVQNSEFCFGKSVRISFWDIWILFSIIFLSSKFNQIFFNLFRLHFRLINSFGVIIKFSPLIIMCSRIILNIFSIILSGMSFNFSGIE